MIPNILDTLNDRGFVSQTSHPDLRDKLAGPTVLYAGFDPTAESLHIGNLLQILLLSQFQRHGHHPVALIGGATAMIGDPSGKSQERNLLDEDTIQRNLAGIRSQLERFLDFTADVANPARLVNNADWIGPFSFIAFLRDVGKHFRVGEMMGKESVRKRLQSDAGMSFTEFSYQLLQAYDFHYLHRHLDCKLQVGGDDQWGNITAGIDLTRRLDRAEVYGLTSPLLTTATGAKFGKTEAGTIWLDANRTSPYEFYQYWVRVDDRDVIKMLKLFTYLDLNDIAELEGQVAAAPETRTAQQVLAEEVTRLVHGDAGVTAAKNASQVLFGQEITGLSDHELAAIFADVPSSEFDRARLNDGLPLLDALVETGVCPSRGQAKKLIQSGGVYLNNRRVNGLETVLTPESLAGQSTLVLRTGKKNYHLVRFPH